jgi:hypothetical protein
MITIKLHDLMGRDVVQCGRKMPKAEEPAACFQIEMCVTVCEDLNFHPSSLCECQYRMSQPEYTMRLFRNN